MKKKINRVSVCAVAAAASLFTTSFSAMGAGAGVGGWRQENEKWKYYDASGILLTGWVKNGNDWYYIDPSTGGMVTGWLHTADGHWYFLNNISDGCKLSNNLQ